MGRFRVKSLNPVSVVKKTVRASTQVLKTAVSAPREQYKQRGLRSFLNPGQATKGAYRASTAVAKSIEKVAVAANPLNDAMAQLNTKGLDRAHKSAGYEHIFAGLFARTGEKAREKPIAATAIAYAAVVGGGYAVGKFGWKGVAKAASPVVKKYLGSKQRGVGGKQASVVQEGETVNEESYYAESSITESQKGPVAAVVSFFKNFMSNGPGYPPWKKEV